MRHKFRLVPLRRDTRPGKNATASGGENSISEMFFSFFSFLLLLLFLLFLFHLFLFFRVRFLDKFMRDIRITHVEKATAETNNYLDSTNRSSVVSL